MALTEQHVRAVIATYIQAWVEKDPDLILSVFTEHATYHERVLDDPIVAHSGIRRYWQDKVVESQDTSCVAYSPSTSTATPPSQSGKQSSTTWPSGSVSACVKSQSSISKAQRSQRSANTGHRWSSPPRLLSKTAIC